MRAEEFYRCVGGSYAEAQERFMNDARIVRFLRMFPSDGSMAALTAAVKDANAEQAFRAVHTLKGIALNLSLTKLAAACSAMTEELRGSSVMPAASYYEAVSREYDTVRQALDALED